MRSSSPKSVFSFLLTNFVLSAFLWGAAVYATGLYIYKGSIELSHSQLTVVILLLQLTASVVIYVSYTERGGISSVYKFLCLIVCVILWVVRVENEVKAISQYGDTVYSFTDLNAKFWEISPTVKPGQEQTTYIACTLEDIKYCVRIRVNNLLIYQPYMLCNLTGNLLNKPKEEVLNYDLLKSTYIKAGRVRLDCKETYMSKLFSIRDQIGDRIYKVIPEPQSSLLLGIIFGYDLAFEDEFEMGIRSAGLSHIIAASGYNVSILILALDKVLLFGSIRAKSTFKLLSIWFYALLTGFSSSMVRACTMTSTTLISGLIDFKIDTKQVFLLTISILIFINPLVVFDIGLTLSAMATFGLLWIVPALEKLIPSKLFPHSTFACTLTTLPVTLFYFQTLSPFAIFANMIVLPVIELVMLLGVAGLIVKPLLYTAWGSLEFVEMVINLFGTLPYALLELNPEVSYVLSVIFTLWILKLVMKKQ
ncbi:ComEC/Rec2 family competence protein [bacterium]|nr:ComEC/Rec2 family competence protein [bacterium]